NPTSIVGPFGQRTALSVDAGGYLASVTNPAGETRSFTYQGAGGLLATHTDPRGGVHRFTYDTVGYLVRDDDPAGGFTALDRTGTPTGYQVTKTTALGRVTTYLVENLPGGDQRWVTTFLDGTRAELLLGAAGRLALTAADGTVSVIQPGPDPR